MNQKPKLHLLTLPIGNLSDISKRVDVILRESDGPFFVEDTRNLKKIFELLGVDKKEKSIFAFHDHDRGNASLVIEQLKRGKDVFYLSDAGSPIISDPGFSLIEMVLDHGYEVTTCPGVSSVTTALELSGLPPHPFLFHGFLVREEKKRRDFYLNCLEMTKKSLNRSMTHICFDSPHRVKKSLEVLQAFSSELQLSWDISVALCRELTKKFETVYRFKASEFHEYESQMNFKGECVLVFYMKAKRDEIIRDGASREIQELAQICLDKRGHPKSVSKLLSKILGESTKDIYQKLNQE